MLQIMPTNLNKKQSSSTKVCISKLKVLSDKSRFQILQLLSKKSMNATEILGLLTISQTLLSHHLRILKTSGLIEGEKKGQFIIYKLSSKNKPPKAANTLNLGCCEIKFNADLF